MSVPHDPSDNHKVHQAHFFDEEVDPEFEISRPHGSPLMYSWMMEEKFRRSVSAIDSMLPGALALTVCGGSGMDAEFVARSGARVISSDLSFRAVRRAQERARRYGFPLMLIVADVEHLPFGGESVEMAYVHDGLHHLPRPDVGLREMARVSSDAVIVTEPARAILTRLAVAVGLAREVEDAGNRVERLELEDVKRFLEAVSFQIVSAQRYGMYYRHKPGFAAKLASLPIVFPCLKAALKMANVMLGRWGNKLTVAARRANHPTHPPLSDV